MMMMLKVMAKLFTECIFVAIRYLEQKLQVLHQEEEGGEKRDLFYFHLKVNYDRRRREAFCLHYLLLRIKHTSQN